MTSPYITEPLSAAAFIERPNRFILFADDGNTKARRTYLANPGKLQEILLPEVTTLLLAHKPHTKTKWECVGARWQGRWQDDAPRAVFLNTGRVNDVAHAYLEKGLVPGLEEAKIIKREVTVGNSRFDFLLDTPQGELLLEVKSVTLVEENLALFPDAHSQRATKHVEELASLAREGRPTAILFIVQGPADAFLPDLHNDLDFAKALRAAADDVEIFAISVPPTVDDEGRLHFPPQAKRLPTPWEHLDQILHDRGLYLAVFELPEARTLAIDDLAEFELHPGFYTYLGDAPDEMTRQINRLSRTRKRKTLHVEYLRDLCASPATFPIRGTKDLQALASDLTTLGPCIPTGFDACDETPAGRLFYSAADPTLTPEFQQILTSWRHRQAFSQE